MRNAMWGMLGASMLLLSACGGESETGNDTDAGSGAGGTSSGGTTSGGSGGTGTGGTATGGTSAGGTAGAASSVCTLPADPGPCDGAMRRWFFDSATGKCTPFIYGGCEGNGNNFQTAMECVGSCAPGVENACTVIACPSSASTCVYTSTTNATCATACATGAACPPGTTCGCGASCSGCKDCIQVCVEVEG